MLTLGTSTPLWRISAIKLFVVHYYFIVLFKLTFWDRVSPDCGKWTSLIFLITKHEVMVHIFLFIYLLFTFVSSTFPVANTGLNTSLDLSS